MFSFGVALKVMPAVHIGRDIEIPVLGKQFIIVIELGHVDLAGRGQAQGHPRADVTDPAKPHTGTVGPVTVVIGQAIGWDGCNAPGSLQTWADWPDWLRPSW